MRGYRLRWRNGVSPSDFNAHVIFIHARRGAPSSCGAVTEIEVEVVVIVLGANAVGRAEVETKVTIVKVEVQVGVAKGDIRCTSDVLPARLNIPALKVCRIPVEILEGLCRDGITRRTNRDREGGHRGQSCCSAA